MVAARNLKDIVWLSAKGGEMTVDAWQDPGLRALGYQISPQSAGGRVLLVLMNAGGEDASFPLPAHPGFGWETLADTAREEPPVKLAGLVGPAYPLKPRTLAILALIG